MMTRLQLCAIICALTCAVTTPSLLLRRLELA